jgi:hypothetical protein
VTENPRSRAVWEAATSRVADLLKQGHIAMDMGSSSDYPGELEILLSDPDGRAAIGGVLLGLDTAGYPNRLVETPAHAIGVTTILVTPKAHP